MKFLFKYIFVLSLFLVPTIALSQEAPKEKAPTTTKAQRKKAKEKWKEQRKLERDQKKTVKEHHKRLQTKETRKSMRKQKRKSERLRANKREFFLIRWFKRK